MESITAYIVAGVVALCFLLIAALISTAIKFEGGSNPKDPKKRKMWFWIFAILTPIVNFILGYFVFMPVGKVAQNKFIIALSIATGLAFILYVLLGLILSKMFKNGKLGNWF
ncbi:MAG: hypothetical protein WCI92_15250 [Bacteroidota bacterium]